MLKKSMGWNAKNIIYVMQCTEGFPQAKPGNYQKSSMHKNYHGI